MDGETDGPRGGYHPPSISVRRQDRNMIPVSIPRFSIMRNPMVPSASQSVQRFDRKSDIELYFRFDSRHLDFRSNRWTDCDAHSTIEFRMAENLGVDTGIMFLSCRRAEIEGVVPPGPSVSPPITCEPLCYENK